MQIINNASRPTAVNVLRHPISGDGALVPVSLPSSHQHVNTNYMQIINNASRPADFHVLRPPISGDDALVPVSNTYSNQLSSELELSSEHGDSISENESQVNNSSLTLDESQLDNNDNSLHAKLINMIQEYTVIWKISSTLHYLINVHGHLLFSEKISRVDALIRWWTLKPRANGSNMFQHVGSNNFE